MSVNLTGAAAASATDSSGTFIFPALSYGSYAVTPSKAGYVFSPVSRAAIVDSASLANLTFTATAIATPTYTISGTVSGKVASGIEITLNGSNVGSTLTDSNGSYSFSGLASGTYTVTATRGGYYFGRPVIVSVTDADSTSNNIASESILGSLAFTAMNALPPATAGSPYSNSVIQSIAGGTRPYVYSVGTLEGGTPPVGMFVNPNGHLTGTPSVPGQYGFMVCAADSAGDVSSCEPTTVTVAANSPTQNDPTVVLTANPSTITAGESSVLSWSSQNTTACAPSGDWSVDQSVSGSATVAPTTTSSYSLECTGPSGTYHAAVFVMVQTNANSPTVTLTASSTEVAPGGTVTLNWASTNATSCTASGGWTGTKVLSGSANVSPAATTTYTLTCDGSEGTAEGSVTVATSQVPTGTSWVYYNGLFDWPGDYSFEAVADYTDTSGGPMSGLYDIKVTLTGAWGGWLPYAQNWNFNSAGYTKLTFALKPTVANQQWTVYFVKVGDIPVGIYLNVLNYGPAPVVGQWNTYTVPLADLGVLGQSIYKFCIQDKTGLSHNTWYVDNVGFTP